MRKIISRVALLGVMLVAFGIAETTNVFPAQAAPVQAAKKTVYICSMHPTVVAAKPGKCPVCKTTLKKK